MKRTAILLLSVTIISGTAFTSCKKKGCTDASALNYDPDAKEDDGTCNYPKRIFATDNTYNGNLKGNCPTAATGTEAADCLCQEAANNAALGGTWKAWISNSTTDASARLSDVGPWNLVGSTTVAFDNLAGLSATPATAINVNENGQTITGQVWTGTALGGSKIGCGVTNDDFCVDWTSQFNGSGGMTGNTANSDNKWTQDGCGGCDQARRLYCVEQ